MSTPCTPGTSTSPSIPHWHANHAPTSPPSRAPCCWPPERSPTLRPSGMLSPSSRARAGLVPRVGQTGLQLAERRRRAAAGGQGAVLTVRVGADYGLRVRRILLTGAVSYLLLAVGTRAADALSVGGV